MVLMSRQNDTEVGGEPLSWCLAKEDTQPVKAKAGCGVGAAIMSACCPASSLPSSGIGMKVLDKRPAGRTRGTEAGEWLESRHSSPQLLLRQLLLTNKDTTRNSSSNAIRRVTMENGSTSSTSQLSIRPAPAKTGELELPHSLVKNS